MRITPLPLKLSYAFLVRDAGAVLVDTGTPGDAPRLRALLANEGVAPADLTLILHTHAHWDHCGSTRQLKEWTKAPTAVHPHDADLMRHGSNGELKPIGLPGRLLKPLLDRPYPPFEPDVFVDDNMDLRPFGVAAHIISTPGHTSGSISLITAEGDAIVGDLFMGGYWGGVLWPQHPTYHYFATDFGAVRASIDKLLRQAPLHIFPGHGGPLDPQRVAQAFLQERDRSPLTPRSCS